MDSVTQIQILDEAMNTTAPLPATGKQWNNSNRVEGKLLIQTC